MFPGCDLLGHLSWSIRNINRPDFAHSHITQLPGATFTLSRTRSCGSPVDSLSLQLQPLVWVLSRYNCVCAHVSSAHPSATCKHTFSPCVCSYAPCTCPLITLSFILLENCCWLLPSPAEYLAHCFWTALNLYRVFVCHKTVSLLGGF